MNTLRFVFGQTVVVIGTSGSGKSQNIARILCNLECQFHERPSEIHWYPPFFSLSLSLSILKIVRVLLSPVIVARPCRWYGYWGEELEQLKEHFELKDNLPPFYFHKNLDDRFALQEFLEKGDVAKKAIVVSCVRLLLITDAKSPLP